MNNNNNNNKKNNPTNKPKKPKFSFYWIYGAIALIFIILQFVNYAPSTKEISLFKLENDMLKPHDVEKITIVNRDFAEIYIKKDRLSQDKYKDVNKTQNNSVFSQGETPQYKYIILSTEKFEEKLNKYQTEYDKQNETLIVKSEQRKDVFGDILGWLLPIVIFIGLWIFIMRKMTGGAGGGGAGGIFNVGKSKAKIFDKESKTKIDFSFVAGLEEAKIEVKEIVDFLKHPKKYTKLGGKIPKGALLVGPPGTGKTLLAKAVAGEANVPFFSMSGSDFVEMFVGVGASRVRDLFKQAKEKSPCIVFIDEIDAIGRARGKNPNMGANDERENTLNQLLTEMDGFDTNSGVIILAATNRADILDKALLRAGRFDRQIYVELPDLNEREAIFKVHLKDIKTNKDIDIKFLAKQTPGFSGADIANVCNESALIAARRGAKEVERQDFLDAIDRIIGGLEKRNKIITTDEKKTIAFHEAGHATISWMLKYAHPLVKVTIVPRGKALGAAWYLPEERQITTTEQILDEMCATLGGRASELINFDKISTGALNDLEKVTKQAYAMIAYYGMSKKLGNISFYDSTGQNEYSFTKPYSEKTAEEIDIEVKILIETQFERAKKILTENKEGLTKLAEKLLTKEVIYSDDLEEIFGKSKYDLYKEEQEKLEKLEKQNKTTKENNKDNTTNNETNTNEKTKNDTPEDNIETNINIT